MYLLIFVQNNDETPVALFKNIEVGRKFLKALPGYKKSKQTLEGTDFIYEKFNPKYLPNYMELQYNKNIIPITKFMFRDKEDVDIVWREIPNMEKPNQGLVSGQTLVDAYVVNNDELKSYIEKRERIYNKIKHFLGKKGYETDRNFYGSQDGEAVVYRKKNEKDWHFLMHMDPIFVNEAPFEEENFKRWIEESLE